MKLGYAQLHYLVSAHMVKRALLSLQIAQGICHVER
jgi:hypothetical protein